MGTVEMEFAMLVDAGRRVEALFEAARTRLAAADDTAAASRTGWIAEASSAYESFLGFLDSSRSGILGRLAELSDRIQITLRDYRIQDDPAADAITSAADRRI